jgi:hypothetical protein
MADNKRRNRGEKTVKFTDRETVYATAKSKHHKPGEKLSLHPEQAANWIEAGKAAATEKEALAWKDETATATSAKGKGGAGTEGTKSLDL